MMLLNSQSQPVAVEAFPLMYSFTRSMTEQVMEHNRRESSGILFDTSSVALISDDIIVMTLRCIPTAPLESGTPFSILGRNVVIQENKATGILIARAIESWHGVDVKQARPFMDQGYMLPAGTPFHSKEVTVLAKAIADYLLGEAPALPYNI